MARPLVQDDASNVEGRGKRRDGPPLQFIGFRLDDTQYAVSIRRVQEIILLPSITRVPQAPPEIEGLLNLRGAILPLVDLRARFGLPRRPPDDHSRVVVVNLGDRTVGMRVDSVTQVIRVPEDQVQRPPDGVASVASSAISGLFRSGEHLVIALDVDRLLEGLQDEPGLANGPERRMERGSGG